MSKLIDLEDYLYWNHPSREFRKYNGLYYKQSNEEDLRQDIEELRVHLLNGEKMFFKIKRL